MSPTFGLSLYLLANRDRSAPDQKVEARPRPEGTLLWIIAHPPTEPETALATAQAVLAADLCDHVLLSAEGAMPGLGSRTLLAEPPADLPGHVAGFLDHWAPESVLLLGDVLRPVCLSELLDRKIPVVLAHGSHPELPDGRRWYPGLVSSLLAGMTAIHACGDAALREYRRAGALPDRLHLSAPLEDDGHCLPFTEAERRALATQLGTRPVWLAVDVPPTEDELVLQAHLTALRATHRLLLVLVPDDPARAAEIARLAQEDHGLNVARRSLDEEPDDAVQVYIADTEGEYGLWYRMAPVCYMGGTLTPATGRALRHPFEPAALGSAILHGPFLGQKERPYVRLRAAGATRIVPSGSDLGETVSDLLEPERAARLAQAAWTVLARSAQASDELLASLAPLLQARPQP